MNALDQLPLRIIPGQFNGWRKDVPPGWIEIVNRLHRRIVAIAPDYQLDQVKEKYGTLRYYVGLPNNHPGIRDAVEALIDEAETESERTCDMCGQVGELFDPSHPEWTARDLLYRTRCIEHRNTGWDEWREGRYRPTEERGI